MHSCHLDDVDVSLMCLLVRKIVFALCSNASQAR